MEKITEKILEEAREEASAYLDEVKRQGNADVEAARQEAGMILEQAKQDAQAQGERTAAKEISAAHSTARRRMLEQKRQLVEEVMEQVQKKLLSLSGKEYEDVIISMLKQVEHGKEMEVILSPMDKKQLGEKLVGLGFHLAEETRPVEKGFLLKKGHSEYNFTVEALLTAERETLEEAAAAVLWEKR